MNVFNRVLLIILLTGVAILAVAVIVFAWASPESAVDVLDEAVDWMEENQGSLEKTLVSSGAGLVALVCVTLLYLELVPHSGSTVGVADLKAGNATLSTDAVAQRIEESIARVPYVSDARVKVDGRRKGVLVDLDVNVDPQANLAQVTDEVCDVVRDVLANRVHVALLEAPTVRLHYREARGARAGARRAPLNATPVRNELPQAIESPVEERAPAVVGPRRAMSAQPEPDARPFNGIAPALAPLPPVITTPAPGTSSTAPPISPRPVAEREVWTPDPPHHPEPLYRRQDVDATAHRAEPEDTRPPYDPSPAPPEAYEAAPPQPAEPVVAEPEPEPVPPVQTDWRTAVYESQRRPEALYTRPDVLPTPPQATTAPSVQREWQSPERRADEEQRTPDEATRDEGYNREDDRLRPTDPYRGNV